MMGGSVAIVVAEVVRSTSHTEILQTVVVECLSTMSVVNSGEIKREEVVHPELFKGTPT